MKTRKDYLLEIAQAACDYANQWIIKSETHLSSNKLIEEGEENELYNNRFNALEKAVSDIREASDENEQPFLSVEAAELYKFIKEIRTIKKYSIGNCFEFAMLALDYCLRVAKDPTINAEIFSIANGDHKFLVLGRKVNSNPSNPFTWGEYAVICDPWSKLVYTADEFESKLKNYYFDSKKSRNTLQDFLVYYHRLRPEPNFNTFYFDQFISKQILVNNYREKIQLIIEDLRISLNNELEKLPVKGKKPALKKDKATLIIKNFGDEILKALKKNILIINDDKTDYVLIKKNLEADLQRFYDEAIKIKRNYCSTNHAPSTSMFSFLGKQEIATPTHEIQSPDKSNKKSP